MRTLQDLYHDPRVLEPDPSLTAIACIQLALETFGIQVQISMKRRWFFSWVFFQCCCSTCHVLQFWCISCNYHLKNYWLYDRIYHALVEHLLINCWPGAFCGHRGRWEAVVSDHQWESAQGEVVGGEYDLDTLHLVSGAVSMYHLWEYVQKGYQRQRPLMVFVGVKIQEQNRQDNNYMKYSGDDPRDGGVHQRGRAAGTSDQAKMTFHMIPHMLYNPLHLSPIPECLFYTARMSWGVHPKPILNHAQRVCRMYKKVSMMRLFLILVKFMFKSWQALRLFLILVKFVF